jgi:hypothetical protein
MFLLFFIIGRSSLEACAKIGLHVLQHELDSIIEMSKSHSFAVSESNPMPARNTMIETPE